MIRGVLFGKDDTLLDLATFCAHLCSAQWISCCASSGAKTTRRCAMHSNVPPDSTATRSSQNPPSSPAPMPTSCAPAWTCSLRRTSTSSTGHFSPGSPKPISRSPACAMASVSQPAISRTSSMLCTRKTSAPASPPPTASLPPCTRWKKWRRRKI